MKTKYYIVAITNQYKVVFASYNLNDLVSVLSEFVSQGRLRVCGLVVRHGDTGERHSISHYLETWTHEPKEAFK